MASQFKLIAVLELLNKMGPGTKAAKKDLDGLLKAAKVLGAGIAATGVVAAGKAAYELGVLGARSLRTKRAFDAISGGALIASSNLDAMRRATRGAMSEQQMMASANRLMQMGLANNAAELEQVTTMATRLGSAMGKEAGPAVEEFALMLANQSIPRLDTFGISAGRVRARILELQAATPGLSREMAFMTATMEEGEAAMERLGEAADDELLANERLEASWADLKAMAGEMLAPAMADVAEAATGVTSAVLEARREMEGLRAEFGDAAVEAAKTEDILGTLADASGILDGEINAVTGELYDAGSAMENLRHQMTDEEIRDVAWAFQETRAKAEDMTPALDTAAGAMDGLATGAKTVAGAFGEMEFDDEQLWKMAAASGANLPELEELAKILGIATDAEIKNTIEGYKLVEMFGDKEIAAEDLADRWDDLAEATAEEEKAAADARIESENLREEFLEGEKAVLKLQEGTDDATGAMIDFKDEIIPVRQETAEFSEHVRIAADRLNDMAGTYEVNIVYNFPGPPPAVPLQAGTAFHRAGLALIGEGGPELVALPRGSRVWPASAPQTRAAINNRYNYGGDTIYINDRLAAALYMERRRRDRMQRIENM